MDWSLGLKEHTVGACLSPNNSGEVKHLKHDKCEISMAGGKASWRRSFAWRRGFALGLEGGVDFNKAQGI